MVGQKIWFSNGKFYFVHVCQFCIYFYTNIHDWFQKVTNYIIRYYILDPLTLDLLKGWRHQHWRSRQRSFRSRRSWRRPFIVTLLHVLLKRGFSVELPPTWVTVIYSVLQCMRPQVPNSWANFLANLALDYQVWSPTHFFCLLLFHSWHSRQYWRPLKVVVSAQKGL